jgi:signal recognition particle GTPase
MFNALTEKLNSILTQLRRRGALTEKDLDEGLRQVRDLLTTSSRRPWGRRF